MSKYTLTYFDGRGVAEMARWLFALADQPYDDVRVPYIQGENPEWLKIKPCEKLDIVVCKTCNYLNLYLKAWLQIIHVWLLYVYDMRLCSHCM